MWVCGDMGRGQCLIACAIAEGRSPAAAGHASLGGSAPLPSPLVAARTLQGASASLSCAGRTGWRQDIAREFRWMPHKLVAELIETALS
jgi:hypothetical protein